jgi:hypothetical protein
VGPTGRGVAAAVSNRPRVGRGGGSGWGGWAARPAGPREAHSGGGRRGEAGWAARPAGPHARGGGAGLKRGGRGGKREKKGKGFPLLKSIF